MSKFASSIRHSTLAAILVAAIAAFTIGEVCAFDPAAEANAAASTYFAPTSLISFRMRQPDGVLRELDYGSESANGIVGARGWSGTVNGSQATVFSGRDVKGRQEYHFESGRLVEYAENGTSWKITPPPMPIREESISTLWPDMQDGKRNADKFFDVWRDIGRFRFAYQNPNRTALLLIELGLLLLTVAFVKQKVSMIAAVVGLAGCFVLTVLTGSRSGLIAFVVSAALYVALRYRQRLFTVRRVLTCLAVLVLAVVCLWGFGGERLTSRLFTLDHSRQRVAAAAPRMMVDAPQGWGDYAAADGYMTGPGKAYYDWYQPSREFSMALTLISDHLTQLVRFGWLGRFGYLFGWLTLLSLLVMAAWRGKGMLALSMWVAFLISTAFNRVMGAWTLWIAPVAVTLALVPTMLRNLRRRDWLIGPGIALTLACALLGAIAWKGSQPYASEVQVVKDGPRVRIKSVVRPDRWLVDDGTVFGGGFFSKEMRLFYKNHPDAPGLGYARSVFDLPKDVHKLVLGGKAGWEFLMGLNDGKFPADFNVPEKILFISPPFPPSAIPGLLLKNVEVKMVMGEFAAAYFEECSQPPAWVTVVKGTELYQPGWMTLVTEL